MRIAPDELSYITAAAWKDIYGHRPGHPPLPKDLTALPPSPKGKPTDIVRSDEATHTRYRRVLSHAFSAKALEEQHNPILSYVGLLIQRLRENVANPQDLVALFNWTTFDLIGDLAFGEPFGCLEHQRYHPWVTTLLKGINGGVAVSAAQRYGIGDLMVTLIPRSVTKDFVSMYETVKEKVGRRWEGGTKRLDFMSHWLKNNREDESGITQREMEENALTIIVAGSDTTASLLAGASFYLMRNQTTLDRITKEIRSTFRNEQEIDCHSVNQLHYLTAVLKETMRMYPPAPAGTPRRVVLHGGDYIDGRRVPQNTTVGIQPWACNRSAFNFHDPDSFNPERWLDKPPLQFTTDSREAMQTFGLGPRNCIGKSLAWLESRIVLARLLWNFDLELEAESRDWVDQKIYLVWSKPPLMAKLTPAKKI